MSIERFESPLGLPFSRMVRANGFVFLSGQIPMDEQGQVVRGDIRTQTHAVMRRIGESLAELGLGFNDVVKSTVWISDLKLFADFNEVYASYVKGALPARSTVEARLALDVDVEVEVIAVHHQGA